MWEDDNVTIDFKNEVIKNVKKVFEKFCLLYMQ